MKNKPKICFISVYLGTPPSYFKMWYESVLFNKDITFLIVCDKSFYDGVLSLGLNLMMNVRFVIKTLEEIKEDIKKSVKVESVSLGFPYKLCDFKPFWGLVYKDYLVEFDFWGYCDLDTIFGDFINQFDLSDEKINRYQRWGHLFLIRNTPEYTNLFLKTTTGENKYVTYLDACAEDINVLFDELNGFYKIWQIYDNDSIRINNNFVDIKFRYFNFYDSNGYAENKFVLLFDNGHLFSIAKNGRGERKELFYCHFQRRKMQYLGSSPVSKYLIVNTRIIPIQDETKDLQQYLKQHRFVFWVESIIFRIKLIFKYIDIRFKRKIEISKLKNKDIRRMI